jgi:hypothetical protein
MSLWEEYKRRVGQKRDRQVSIVIDPSHVDREISPVTIEASRHYVQFSLAHLFLKRENRWPDGRSPAVLSLLRVPSREIPILFNLARRLTVENHSGRMSVERFPVTPETPFNGGIVSFSVGLIGVDPETAQERRLSETHMRILLEEEILHSGLGFIGEYSEGELSTGYLAVINASEHEIDPVRLWVVRDQLRVGSGPGDQESVPLVEHDYLLLRVDVSETREDYEFLWPVQNLFRDALNSLRDSVRDFLVSDYFREALLSVLQSSDLTGADKRRMFNAMIERFALRNAQPKTKGPEGGSSLGELMLGAINVDEALEQGEPAIEEFYDADLKGRDPILATRGSGGEASLETESIPRELTPPPKRFFFKLEGTGAKGNQVQYGADVDLVFSYDSLISGALAMVSGKKLQEIVTEEAELGVAIIPRGFSIRDGRWRQRAKFQNEKLTAPLRFQLKASATEMDDAGVQVLFDRAGSPLYEFFLPITLTENPGASQASPNSDAIDLDLDEVKRAADRQGRAAILTLSANGDEILASYVNLETQETIQKPLEILTRASLAVLIGNVQDQIDKAANHISWSQDGDPMDPLVSEKRQKSFRECLEFVADAGSALFEGLRADADFKLILERIDALPAGSRLSIRTDCAFLPWEILYAGQYVKDASYILQAQELWGYKYSIECLLLAIGDDYKTPLKARRSGSPFVSYNLNPTIDDKFKTWVFKPVKAQEDWASQHQAQNIRIEIQNNGQAIRAMLSDPGYEADFIYLYCHGRNQRAFLQNQKEEIELDKGVFFEPRHLPRDLTYPRGPIIFLNSCNSGAISPLSFSSFLSQFRQRKALGLLTTSFPIPALFAASFGDRVIRGYLASPRIPLGDLLLYLRRDLLNQQNPLGLFYSLQCLMDVTAPDA